MLAGHVLSQLSYGPKTLSLQKVYKTAEHPIGTLAPRGTSIVYLLAEFEPLTIAIK